jgi:hypothetical protein
VTPDEEPTSDPLAGVDPEHVLFLTGWASRHGATVTFAGECGLGRKCVGVLAGHAYLDYGHLHGLFGHDEDKWALWWTPEDSYHKRDCMAVLGRGPDAVAQLYEWAKWLDGHGWTVTNSYRQPKDHLDAAFHGLTEARLMPPDAPATGPAGGPDAHQA